MKTKDFYDLTIKELEKEHNYLKRTLATKNLPRKTRLHVVDALVETKKKKIFENLGIKQR